MDDADRDWKLRQLELEARALRAVVLRLMTASNLAVEVRGDFFLADDSIEQMLDPIAQDENEMRFMTSYMLNIVRESRQLLAALREALPEQEPEAAPTTLRVVKPPKEEPE